MLLQNVLCERIAVQRLQSAIHRHIPLNLEELRGRMPDLETVVFVHVVVLAI
jgi:hypothetical protein